MKYIKLELSGYIRTALNNIDYICIEPTEPTQLILGTNGSGKSSLLSELSPMPANANDFKKGSVGFKNIVITHRGSTYELRNTFSTKATHSFIKDTEEMNPGGTVTVQKELIYQEFGFTQDIHDLYLGTTKFTKMLPLQRREWFTLLSEVSYDYAIGLFTRIRERSRDVSGALKIAKSRLVSESAKFISQDEQIAAQKEVNDTHELLNHLAEYRKPVEADLNQLQSNVFQIMDNIDKYSTQLITKKVNLATNFNFTNKEEIRSRILELQAQEKVSVILIEKLHAKHKTTGETIEILKKTEEKGIQELSKSISDIYLQQGMILSSKTLGLDIHETPEDALRAIQTISETLEPLFLHLPSNPDKRYSRASLTETTEKVDTLKNKILSADSALATLYVTKQHHEAHRSNGQTQCPSCKHQWFKGFDQLIYNNVVSRIDEGEKIVKQLRETLASAEEDLANIYSYFVQYKAFQDYVITWPVLSAFWNYLLEKETVLKNPKQVITELSFYKQDLSKDVQHATLAKEVQEKQQLIGLSEKVGSADIHKLKEEQNDTETQMVEISMSLHSVRMEAKQLSLYEKDIETILELQEKLEKLSNEAEELTLESIETLRRTHLNDCIRQLHTTLARREEFLAEIKNQKNIILDLEKQIKALEIDEICLKALSKELSPTDGLIAEGLLGFVKLFVSRMNAFIKKIWTYPLTVIPCGVSEVGKVELDYRFPLKVKDQSIPVSDVSKGSEAMLEIIDLAFKLVAMKFLGLSESPLLLDEFGSAMDKEHKIAGMTAIRNLIAQEPFTQLFMISHDNGQYGSLVQTQVCVLCPGNIVIPSNWVYNQHVVIT